MESIKDPILQIKDVSIAYGNNKRAVKNVTADVAKNTITAIMGPSGCGKSTLLRSVNRMHELYPEIRTTGQILLDGKDVLQMNCSSPFPALKCAIESWPRSETRTISPCTLMAAARFSPL